MNIITEPGHIWWLNSIPACWITNEREWIELNKIRFTADNTARKGYRMDYCGGVKGKNFFLRNCVFFNDYTFMGSTFEKTFANKRSIIDLEKLP